MEEIKQEIIKNKEDIIKYKEEIETLVLDK